MKIIFTSCMCICMHAHMHTCMYMDMQVSCHLCGHQNNLQMCALLFCHASPRDEAQVVRIGGKCCFLLRCLTSPLNSL